jgi:tetratricopeptide (TPR) repeat protein
MTAAAVESKRWLFGPAPDLLLGCGLWYVLLFAVAFALGDTRAFTPDFLAPLLVLLLSTPHYGATILRVYEQRAERRRYAVFSVWATLAIAAWFVAGQHSAAAGSWLLTLYLTWSPWHYTGQNYGISVMLLGRRGVPLDPVTKRWLHLAFVSSYALVFAVIHESSSWATSRALPLASGGIHFIPIGTPRALATIAAIAAGVALIGALQRLVARAALRDLGPALLLLASQVLWFVLPALALHWRLTPGREPLGNDVQIYFLVWIAVAHAVQYLWITAYYARATRGWNGAMHFLARTFAAGAAVWTLPAIAFAPRWLGAGGFGYEAGLALLIASAINIHHFVLDGAIWKLRDGPIARVLIRSETGAQVADARPVTPWRRRAAWALAGGCAAIAAFVFAAEFFLVPRALASDDRPRAGALLDALALVGRDSARSRGELGQLAARAGRYEEGAGQFERSAALLPTREAYVGLVAALAAQGRFEAAASHCDELLALAPEDASAMQLAAMVYQRLGRDAEASALRSRAEMLNQPPPAEMARARRPAVY